MRLMCLIMSNEGTINSIQHQVAAYAHRAANIMPDEYRGELWIYAAGYVFLYTILMLFYMSTFGFICVMVYTTLLTMLILRYFNLGPLAARNT